MTSKKGGRGKNYQGPPLGVWLIGARGGLATTLIAGTTAISKNMVSSAGMLTETDLLADLELAPLDRIHFGGHETRNQTLLHEAESINSDTGTIPDRILKAIKPKLRAVDREIKPGRLTGAGRAITRICSGSNHLDGVSPAETVVRLTADMVDFMRRKKLKRMVVVNLASTEPTAKPLKCLQDLKSFRRALKATNPPRFTPSTLYAMAALEAGCAFINFTPSVGAMVPAIKELALEKGLPIMGSDGKSGETLVKSALAPMFKYRNLRILSWQGYNILGDRDGEVLSEKENKDAKISTKDSLLPSILGYPLHTHVGIDYVPSLGDLKTAWDFIHFQGFLDYRMSMQFSWHGCDAILAAPLVLDMVRLSDLSLRNGDAGLMPWLGIYFKQPQGTNQQDLHHQWHTLTSYLEGLKKA